MPYQKPGMSYQWRLFSGFLAMCLVLIICFVGFQFIREKKYKSDILGAELQILNAQILDRIEEGHDLQAWLDTIKTPFKDLRVTVVNSDGQYLYNNTLDDLPGTAELRRRQLMKDFREGRSYSIRRGTPSDADIYFYSNLRDANGISISTGAPYEAPSVSQVLVADQGFLWFMLVVSIIIGVIGYYSSRNIGQTITRLADFAEKAERGADMNTVTQFPRDELGKIASNIVSLYNKFLLTTEERDRQQLMLIHEEEEKQRIKRDLTHNINHELKTPVASVLGCAETLVDHPDLPEAKRQEFMERIVANAKRLSALLRDVSTINRLDEGSSQIQKDRINLSNLIEEVVCDATPRGAKVGIMVSSTVPPDIKIIGNQTILESIFRNLVENAIAYSGGTKVVVGVMERNSETVTFNVTDNGCGIPEEHFAKIFDRFYRIDKGRSRKAGGTGLGLAIVQSGVAFHGGDITIANVPEGGLEFAVTFPLPRD